MLKEMVAVAAFLLALSGIAGTVAVVQRVSAGQEARTEQTIEAANEID